MPDWMIALVLLLFLFALAVIERSAVDRKSRDAWERASKQYRIEAGFVRELPRESSRDDEKLVA